MARLALLSVVMASSVRGSDGSYSFSGGVDSSCVTTVRSALTVDGLPRNMVAWASNATFRGGGICCRNGWKPLVDVTHAVKGNVLTPTEYAAAVAAAASALAAYNSSLAVAAAANTDAANKLVAMNTAYAAYQATPNSFTFATYNSATASYNAAEINALQAAANARAAKTVSDSAAAVVSNAASGIAANVSLGLFQGAWMYDNAFELPYIIASIGGRIYKIICEAPFTVTDLSSQFGFINPANVPQAFFCQGEEFLVIQAGDYPGKPGAPATKPLFWDGAKLWRSKGITNTAIPVPAPGVNEIPAALSMDFYMQRFWYAQGRTISAGDIVGGAAGTIAYKFRDAILNVTENPLCFGGDGFTVPASAGNLRAIKHTNSTNEVLGQGDLFFGSRKQIFKLVVPVTRTDWIAADKNNMPKLTVAQNRFGFYGDRSVVQSNTDLFYRSPDGIRSLTLAIANFGSPGQWGNTPLSNNENRIFPFENRALLHYASGIQFDNRMLQTCIPVPTSAGVAFRGIIPLDFDLISTLQEKRPPAWEGILEGLLHLQLLEGDFGGRQRAFSFMVSEVDGSIQIWELTDSDRFDSQDNQNGGDRIEWAVEFPAFTFGKEMEMKQLDGLELWMDKVFGEVEVTAEWRPDADVCWHTWNKTSFCSARSTCEDLVNPVCYPTQPYRENYKFPVTFPKPPQPNCNSMNQRPLDIGYQFQVRVTIKGWARIRGMLIYSIPTMRKPFEGLSC